MTLRALTICGTLFPSFALAQPVRPRLAITRVDDPHADSFTFARSSVMTPSDFRRLIRGEGLPNGVEPLLLAALAFVGHRSNASHSRDKLSAVRAVPSLILM